MSLDEYVSRGLVLLGCGKMGSAMLEGWLSKAIEPSAFTIIEPYPSDFLLNLEADGLRLNKPLPMDPAICVIAVKPQMMQETLPQLSSLGNADTLFVSIAAGTSLNTLENILGAQTPIVRAMPNTPAAIKKGISAIIGNEQVKETHMLVTEELLQAVGQTVRLSDESQIDAVTAVSGSGPAYVFHLIETMAKAGERQGLPECLALELAKATVAGAGALAEQATEDPTQLRINVTSPNGTTQAALEVLMHPQNGFPSLLDQAIAAATKRGKELGE